MGTRRVTIEFLGEDKSASKTAKDVEKNTDGLGKKLAGMGSKAAIGLAGAGAVAGTALIGGITKAMDTEKANDKLAAQLGANGPKMEQLGKVAGDLYSNAYGESIADVDVALKSVMQDISGMGTASSADLQKVTGAVMDVSTAFDQDLGGVTRATGQLMKTGLAKNATEALDIITKGFQSGADKSEDFLDTLNEYGTQFRKLGLSGEAATGLISQGLKAGARDGDLVADSLKEFSIRAIDGSTLTATSFKALGLNAKEMQKQIAGGGVGASKGLDAVLDKLRAVKDPAKQAQIATGLFGTQAEDLGAALFALDPSKAVGTLGQVDGAAAKMGKTLNDNASTNLESFKRQIGSTFVTFVGGKALPVLGKLSTNLATKFKPAMDAVVPKVKEFGVFLKTHVQPQLERFGGFLTNTAFPALKRFYTDGLAGAKSALDKVKKALQDNEPQLRKLASGISTVVTWVVQKLGPILGWLAKTQLKLVGQKIADVITFIGKLVDAGTWLVKKTQDVAGKISGAWGTVKSASKGALDFVVDKFLGFVGVMIDGAAKAFGWVPGLGDKLKNASKDFRKFRDETNASLAGIKDQEVGIKPVFDKNTMSLASAGRRAMGGPGGPISGPGTGTSDQAGLYALSNGEHVFTDEEVRKAGGHTAIYRLRQSIRTGRMKGFRDGGSPGFTVRAGIPAEGASNAFAVGVAAGARAIAQPIAQALAGKLMMGPGGPAGSVQSFRGERLNARTIAMLLAAERILGRAFNIMQGSYSTRVAASGGTHAGGGVMDTDGPGGWNRAVSALRRVGFAAWHRTPAQGPWGHHIHSVALGDSTASPSARRQAQDYLHGGDGLGSYRNGTPFVPADGLYRLHRGERVTPETENRRRAARDEEVIGVLKVIHQTPTGAIIRTELLKLKRNLRGAELGIA